LDEALPGETSYEIRDLQNQIKRIITTTRYQVGLKKVPAVIDYLRTCTGKTLVFAYHHDVILALVTALADRGVAWFTGGSSLKNRDRAANRFQADPDCRFFVGNIEAAGHGITLTTARHVVFAEPDWRGTYLEQVEDRARTGSANTIRCWLLICCCDRMRGPPTAGWRRKLRQNRQSSTLFWTRRRRKTPFGY
jgi:hypothetical protein